VRPHAVLPSPIPDLETRDSRLSNFQPISLFLGSAVNNTAHSEIRPRHLVITRVNGHTQRIPSISRLWEPLAYPLFFPHGTLGWGLVGNSNILPEGITSDGIDFCLLHISS